MTNAIEVIGGFCTVFGVLWGFYTYYNRTTPDYKEARQYMLEQFELLKSINLRTLVEYETFADRYSAWEANIAEGLTLRFGIEKMRLVREELLRKENVNLQTTTRPIRNIEGVIENVKKQIEYHSGLLTTLEVFQNHINTNHPYLNDMANNLEG